MCPLTIHALLHVADSIRATGPVWAAWEFPMERFCGTLLPALKNRRYPYASLSHYAVDIAQLYQIELLYDMQQELSLRPQSVSHLAEYKSDAYPKAVLRPPHRVSEISLAMHTKIAQSLATRFDTTMAVARRIVPRNLSQWGKVQRVDGGDLMHAADIVSATENTRDATYVRYQLLVDRNARNTRVQPQFTPKNFYGQLRNIFVLNIPSSRELRTSAPSTLLLAAIQTVKTKQAKDISIAFYKEENKAGPIEVVDLAAIQCLVGRVYDTQRKWWGFIDRSGPLAQAAFIDEQ
ncbi:hypothetical protein B0H21DRAFT_857356 [Amylocystis lapponica]|nr:hypothetical protein B0H21DRAFT_857356 [Amylocystis lapponica]